ncbi:MAG: type II restriction endonuclease TdeIII, partial [Candidatus Berkelbacteria bacterium Athens1014_28]
MALSKEQTDGVEAVLKTSIRNKFQNYEPEPASMPFHTRLLGKDRLALYSFIHSLNTNFGSSVFEPVALEIAKANFKLAKAQIVAGDKISSGAQIVIQKIIDGLTTANTNPNKTKEIEAIKQVCQK